MANYTLSFNLPYLKQNYRSISVNVNGFVYLNGTALLAAYSNFFCTNSSGSAVFSREVNQSAELTAISSRIQSVFSNYPTFSATNAFVVTWYNVALVSSQSQLNTFQMILATDSLNTFAIFYFVRLDSIGQLRCMYTTSNGTSLTDIVMSANCTSYGSLVALVNVPGNRVLFFDSDFYLPTEKIENCSWLATEHLFHRHFGRG
jgi:hypothetical protein